MLKVAFNIALFSYLGASIGYFGNLLYRKRWVSVATTSLMGLGLVAHTALMGIRSSQTGHGPYTTAFEIAMFFSWIIVVVYILTELKFKIQDLGAFVIPLVFLILLYSAFLSREVVTQETGSVLWMTLHRTLSILGYGAFAIAFAAALMYLIQENQVKSKKLGMMYFRMPSLEVLDKLLDRVIAFGFPLFTLGFVSGSIWNTKVKHDFFSWNLEKTWPLIVVWGVYGVVYFGRMTVGIRGKKAAQGAILGFVLIIVAYFIHV
ncbi:MAG: cytochrome C assembly protein [Nitrospinae bacterium CG11_big_fil_rev_8_21_14_0_20_56_8]|nr:MAG: cytochrome C assembly protein [Nitrospinae bacterium CG11_big_fil_rev_8_21_14_0_20_56_8]